MQTPARPLPDETVECLQAIENDALLGEHETAATQAEE